LIPTTTMRILHVLDHSLPEQSGYSFRTVSILREQRALGWETFHLTTPRQGATTVEFEEVDGWRFLRTPFSPGAAARAIGPLIYPQEMSATASRLDALVDELKPDILHAHSPVLTALPSLWVGRRRRIPVVYEVRALWEDGAVDHGTTREGSLRYRLSKSLETFALRRATRVTTICEGLRREITGRGVPAGRIEVIPNAVDTSTFRTGGEKVPELIRSLRLEGCTVLGFIGSFYGYEGLELLVDAFAELSGRDERLRLLLVGGGPQEESLRSRVEHHGLLGRVIMTGRVPHREVTAHYDAIDLLVYPRLRTRLTEHVTPLKPLEAMAQGRLLLASDVGGHHELIRDGDNGFLFAAGDAHDLVAKVEALLARREQWPEVCRRARAFVERERTWKSSVARYAAVYEGAIAAVRMPGEARADAGLAR
jgi:PEP-CTERM/exosortase A-associated glycosyltransferase